MKSRDHSNLSAQCKGLVLTGDQSKRLTPYLENGLKNFLAVIRKLFLNHKIRYVRKISNRYLLRKLLSKNFTESRTSVLTYHYWET